MIEEPVGPAPTASGSIASDPAVAAPPAGVGQPGFVGRVAGVFAARISVFAIGLVTSLLLAGLLGKDGRGEYAVVMLVPGTLYALATFGLPSSTTFYAGRGRSLRSLRKVTLVMAAAASIWLMAMALAALPFLEKSFLQTAPDYLLKLVLLAIPFQFGSALLGCILFGRQVVRNYNAILVVQSAALLVGILLLTGVFGLGVYGAVVAFLLTTAAGSAAVLLEVGRVVRHDEPGRQPVRYGELLGYGFKLYPSVITSFFNYRADVFLLSWLLASQGQIGLYVVAVSLAEIAFYPPDAISSIFFPRVAAASRAEADRAVADVSRLTLLTTLGVAVAIVPAALFVCYVILPGYTGAIPALLVLLPGVVALSISKVLQGYLIGLGKAWPVGVAAGAAVVANVGFNLVLIPAWGIVGASASSLLSYSLNAAILALAASRSSGQPVWSFVLIRPSDVRRLLRTGLTLIRRLLAPRVGRASTD